MATTILVALIIFAIQTLSVLEGSFSWTSVAIALMVLMILIVTGFHAGEQSDRSPFLVEALQAFEAGLMAYIVLSPVTHEVVNANFVMAYIVTLIFCLAYFDFGIKMDERRARKLRRSERSVGRKSSVRDP